MSAARRAALGLAILTALAFGIRLVGIDFGAPLWEEGDAYFAGHVELLRKGVDASKRTDDNVQYPSFVPRCVALLPERPVPPPGSDLEAHLSAARGTFVQVRTFVALLGVLVIPLTYLLTRRVADRGWSLFAAAIPAVSLLHLCFSQQARPHAALATLFLATILLCLRLRRRPTAGMYLAAGTMCALSIGCLHSGVMMGLPLLAAHLTAERPAGRSRWLEPRLLLAAAPIVAAVPLFYSYVFDESLRDSKNIFRIENGHVYMSTHKLSLEMWNGSGAASLLRILQTWEPELLVLLPLALAGWLLARARGEPRRLLRGDGLPMAAFLVPYLALLVAYSRTYERFLLPVLPFAAAFCAYGASRLLAGLAPALRRALAGILVLLLAVPAWASVHWAWVRSQPGTMELAGAWVSEHVSPAGERIYLTPPYDLPLSRSELALKNEEGKRRTQMFSVWSRYLNRLDEAERPGTLHDIRWLVSSRRHGDLSKPAQVDAFLDEHGPGVYVIEVARGARGHPFLVELAAALARRGRLMTRLSPDPDPYYSDHPLADEDEEVDDWPGFFWRSLSAHASGLVVEVYRVP